jgi:hypothetical protein
MLLVDTNVLVDVLQDDRLASQAGALTECTF